MTFNPAEHPHRRYNPLTGEWVLVSPQRTQRPWQGKVEPLPAPARPAYDPDCYLCPGNRRAGDQCNPNYTGTFVFRNDFAALMEQAPEAPPAAHPLIRTETSAGTCRVICYSPRHDLTLAEMPPAGLRAVVDLWIDQARELGRLYRWVQIFENKGEPMGCSNPHPHGQIWATSHLPTEPAKEGASQRAYFVQHGAPLLADYAKLESGLGERVVAQNPDWLAVVPFWAVWPFETLLMPRRHVLRLTDLNESECESLAEILKRLLVRYDNLFEVSFPYSMGWHGAPNGGDEARHWQLHAHFYPPLLRSATVRKFLVGFEMLAEAQRDLTAEQAAARLRELPDVHFATRKTGA